MVRILHILAFCVLLAAGVVLGLAGSLWWRGDPALDGIRHGPSALEVFQQMGRGTADRSTGRSPLVAQAEAFALHLNPPRPPQPRAAGLPERPPLRPLAPGASFRLRGTTYYPNQPDRSLALVAETGAPEGAERWVREGSRLGHFVVQEIRRGALVYRDGASLREMTLEPGPNPSSLVRDIRPGSRQVSAAVDFNSLEAAGNENETTAQ